MQGNGGVGGEIERGWKEGGVVGCMSFLLPVFRVCKIANASKSSTANLQPQIFFFVNLPTLAFFLPTPRNAQTPGRQIRLPASHQPRGTPRFNAWAHHRTLPTHIFDFFRGRPAKTRGHIRRLFWGYSEFHLSPTATMASHCPDPGLTVDSLIDQVGTRADVRGHSGENGRSRAGRWLEFRCLEPRLLSF